jgi:2-polyprenyl-3-methyl-5-hydroxy-6-metoxy-1,4-benzoquinol methylase
MALDEQWQLEGTAAELYQRYLVPLITSLWAADLVERSAPRPDERVLDVACGTGVVARLAAERMGTGRVVGLDLNSGMLAVARTAAQNGGPKVEWHEASVLWSWDQRQRFFRARTTHTPKRSCLLFRLSTGDIRSA